MIIPNLEVVYPPNLNVAPPRWRPLVNLICVHDIGGSPKTTWHDEESGKTWISDPEFLGDVGDSVRVWTYGFNSDPAVNMTPSSIALHANELLAMLMSRYIDCGRFGATIFIAHGLGGLIVKKAVILALSCPEYIPLRDGLNGIVFLDTIHHATDSDGVLTAVKTISVLSLQKGSLKPSSDDTRQYADAVREVNATFIDRLPSGLEMINFVATRRVDVVAEDIESHKALVVPKYRAILESPQSKTIMIDCHHFGLTHFSSFSDNIYQQIAEPVGDMITKLSKEVSKRMFVLPPPLAQRKSPSTRSSSPDPGGPIKPSPRTARPIFLPPPKGSEDSLQTWISKRNIDSAKERRDKLVNKTGLWDDVHLGHDIHPTPGTCAWILSHSFFLEWCNSDSTEDFYVYGDGGTGKTHLAKCVANYLAWDDSRQVNNIVLPFFCTVGATGNRKPPIMEYFIRSLARMRPSWFDTLGPQYPHPDSDGKLSLGSMFNILRDLITRLQPISGPARTTTVFLIVDGLHECDMAFVREFLRLVTTLVEHPVARAAPPLPMGAVTPPLPLYQLYPRETVRIKFFFTYCPNEIMSLASAGATRVGMADEDIRRDISTYVDKALEDLLTVKSIRGPPEGIGTWIKEKAQSFFPFAKYSLDDALSTASDDSYGYSMNRRILPCPRTLGRYYDHDLLPLLQSIDNEEYVLSALMIIAGSFNSVAGHEISDALACLHDNFHLRFLDIQTVMMHRCPRLVKFSDDLEISFIHPSFKFHLRSYIDEEEQQANMASLCLKYLSWARFERRWTAQDLLHAHPFYKYAANNWQEHLRRTKDKRMKLVPGLRKFFESPSYVTWSRYIQEDSGHYLVPPVIALVPANAGDMVHLTHDVFFDDDPETYPWKDGAWGWFWRSKRKMRWRFRAAAKFIDSFKDRKEYLARDSRGMTALMHAAKAPLGLPDMVHHFLQWPGNINCRDNVIGATALMFLCRYIDIPGNNMVMHLVDAFIHAGADVNMSTFQGETPLWLACCGDNLDLVEHLLAAGANPNIACVDGSTPLYQAFNKITPSSEAVIGALVEHGADLDIKFPPPSGLIPLTAAILNGLFDTFLILLGNVKDINQLDDAGLAAIHVLVQPKYVDWLPHLLERRDVDLELLSGGLGRDGSTVRKTALSFAITDKSFRAVELLLQAGASAHRHPASSDQTPLYVAVESASTGSQSSSEDGDARSGNLDIARLLLSYQTPINTVDAKSKRYERSPLMLAVNDENCSMVKLLLEHGADPTVEEAYDIPGPLDAAVHTGNIAVTRMLLEHHIPPSINYVPKGFNHILVDAAGSTTDIVQLLLDHGADTKRFLAPINSQTPLQTAVLEPNLAMCKLFIQHEPDLVNYQDEEGMTCETALNIAAREGHLDIVRCLLDAGAKPDLQAAHFNETPLWSACSRGRLEIARLLYEKAPQTIDTPSYEGETPLMAACSSGVLKLVSFLLEHGADMTPRCFNCGSCVAKALSVKTGAPAYKIIELLIQHGLGVDDVVSSLGYTVLGEACRSGDLPSVRLLLEMGANPIRGQRGPGNNDSESRWRSAAQVAVSRGHFKVLDYLLEHPTAADFIGNIDFRGETMLHTNIAPAKFARVATKVHAACERVERETGVDYFGKMLSVENFRLNTPLDTALGKHHSRPTGEALAKTDEIIGRYVSELVRAPERTLDGHFYLIRDLSRLLLSRHGYDAEASRLVQTYIVDAWVKQAEDHFDETVFCEYYCDECGDEEEEEKLYFCRYCVFNTGQCCFGGYKGIHELVEVPVVMDRSILNLNSVGFMNVLRYLEQKFVADTDAQPEEDKQVAFEEDAESDDTTLSLAFLHALGYLEFRRRAWSPYLPLAPRVQKRIEPWEWIMEQPRREFQEWVWYSELGRWRLRGELGYFLESGRRTAYQNLELVKTELIVKDVGWLFHEPRSFIADVDRGPGNGNGQRAGKVVGEEA